MGEPMDIDTIDSDFDKENHFQHSNVLSRTPCTEKGYEELDVSELNMKLRYSLTPASSPMSKSYNVNCTENKFDRGDNSSLIQIDPSKMTQSLNSTVNQCDTLKTLKVLHSEPLTEIDRSVSILRSLDSISIKDNIPVIVDTVHDDDNLSLPSTSSLPHTPEATTPITEIPKEDGGSPIMRGLKSVLSMFRPSQSPIMTSEEKSPTIASDAEMQKLLMSTPISSQKQKDTANKSPQKESITFIDDLEKELQWKDETTVMSSQEKTLIHKNSSQMKVSNEMDNQKEVLNESVRSMDVSCNDSIIENRCVIDNQTIKLTNKVEITFADSDNEFLDCETTFTKDESLYVDANINSETGTSNENVNQVTASINIDKKSEIYENVERLFESESNVISEAIQNDMISKPSLNLNQDVSRDESINSQEILNTTLTKTTDLENTEVIFDALLEYQRNEQLDKSLNDEQRYFEENKETITCDIQEYDSNDTINGNNLNQTLTLDQNSTIDIITSIENITKESEKSNITLKNNSQIDNGDLEENVTNTDIESVQQTCDTKLLPSEIPLPQENEFVLEDSTDSKRIPVKPVKENVIPVNVETCLPSCQDGDLKPLLKDIVAEKLICTIDMEVSEGKSNISMIQNEPAVTTSQTAVYKKETKLSNDVYPSPQREDNSLLTVTGTNNDPAITEIPCENGKSNVNLSQPTVESKEKNLSNEVCLVTQNKSLFTEVTQPNNELLITEAMHADNCKISSDNVTNTHSAMENIESTLSSKKYLITQEGDIKPHSSTDVEKFDKLNTTVECTEKESTDMITLPLQDFRDKGDLECENNSKLKSEETIQRDCTGIVDDSETTGSDLFSKQTSPELPVNKEGSTELEYDKVSTVLDNTTPLDDKTLNDEIPVISHAKDIKYEDDMPVTNINNVPEFLFETNEEEVLLSENNSPYVSLTVNEPETDQNKEENFVESVNQITTKSETQNSPPSSPKIVSKGNYNFNFDEIDDPFATKTKIRLSPPPSTQNQTFEIIENKLEPPNKGKQSKPLNKVSDKRKSQGQKRKSPSSLKQNIKAVNEISTQQKTIYDANDDFKLNDIALAKSKPDLTQNVAKIANGETILHSDTTEMKTEAIMQIQNSAVDAKAESSSSEPSTYFSAPSSTDSTNSKNVFNIPEIAHSKKNPFVSVSKIRQSPVRDQCLDVNLESKNALSDDELNCSTSSKVTDDKNLTVREINTEDEDTIEGPFLEVEDLNDVETKPNYEVNKVDMIQFSDINQESEDNAEGEMFIDAEAFEFLLNQNNVNMVADSGKESLFLKFDPLFAKRVSAEGVLANVRKGQKKQSTPKKNEKHPLLESTIMDISAVPGTSNVMDMSYEITCNATFEDRCEESMNNTVIKPTMAVTPAVNSAISPRNKTFTPSRSNRRSYTFTSPAIAVIDRLLSMSGNNSILGQDTTTIHVSNEQHEAELALTQLRELLAEKEINVHQLKCETNELRYKLETFELQIKKLEEQSQERLQNIDSLNAKLAEKTRDNKNMAVVVEEYERTIASLIAEKEQEKRQREEERMQLIRDRDEQIAHLANMECSFNDLHSKYEKSKGIILSYKANEDTYKKTVKDCQEKIKKMHDNYELLKQHATSKLNHANQELEKINRAHEAEVLKLHTMMKRREVEITSLEESLAQKTKANDELAAICDELINKVG